MSTNGSADQGHVVQGMIVKVKPQGDGTLKFDVTCHDSKGRVACRELFLLPPKSPFHQLIEKGKLARVSFERATKERQRPLSIEVF